jgi:hypothetical protein
VSLKGGKVFSQIPILCGPLHEEVKLFQLSHTVPASTFEKQTVKQTRELQNLLQCLLLAKYTYTPL